MSLWTVTCDDCQERWRARFRDGEVIPVHEACPNCGATAFSVPSHDD